MKGETYIQGNIKSWDFAINEGYKPNLYMSFKYILPVGFYHCNWFFRIYIFSKDNKGAEWIH